jgi:hypothetical protein
LAKFKVTLLVPTEREIEARDMQDAHNYVSKMMRNAEGEPLKVLSIDEVEEPDIFSDE